MAGGDVLLDDVTEPLPNGAELPKHPASTNGRRIVDYGLVSDAETGHRLHGGLHHNEITNLIHGEQMGLSHLFRYAIRNNHIYHTRPAVIIAVKVVEDADLP